MLIPLPGVLQAADVDTVKAAYEQAEAHLSALEGLVPALQQHYWEAPRPSLPASPRFLLESSTHVCRTQHT
jgi:hypothetical protein